MAEIEVLIRAREPLFAYSRRHRPCDADLLHPVIPTPRCATAKRVKNG